VVDVLWVKAVVKALVLPPTGLLLVAALGIGLVARFPRGGRYLASAGILGLLVLSMPIVADSLEELVDTAPTLDLGRATDAKAVVILGGGMRRGAPEFGGDTLSSLTLERVRYGARVARATGLPVLVSGGSVLGGTPEGALMKAALEQEFDVRVQWVESLSRTTHENAVRSAVVLRREGIGRVLLVAHAIDMRRAMAEFAAEGIETIGAPTGKRGEGPYTLLDFLPGMRGLLDSYYATYEIAANLVRVAYGQRW
jgi:uncharacterized SAM-binding protein YcdF (DUF218 family)